MAFLSAFSGFPLRVLMVFQVAILPATLLHLTGLLFPRLLRLERESTLLAALQLLHPVGQQLARNLLILGARASRLRLDHQTRRFMNQLDGGVCFVLGASQLCR